jgi:hypothetical protein
MMMPMMDAPPRRLTPRRLGKGLGGFLGYILAGAACPRCLVLLLFADAKQFRMVDGPALLSGLTPSTATGLKVPTFQIGGFFIVPSFFRVPPLQSWELLVKGNRGWLEGLASRTNVATTE